MKNILKIQQIMYYDIGVDVVVVVVAVYILAACCWYCSRGNIVCDL